MNLGLLLYGTLWLSFALGHSLLASRPVRAAVIQRVGPAERLIYNLVAVLHLAIVLVGGRLLLGAAPAFEIPQALGVCLTAMGVVGAVGIAAALLGYDLGRFSGLTQWRTRRADDLVSPDAPLVITGLHRYVRHPLYTASIMALWGGAGTPLGLATAVFGTAYLAVGLRFEERKLLAVHGSVYAAYRERVPALLPNLFARR